ncbi:hypothetical protein [Peptostreptococcus equinus]|uniref:BppU N-terminal domain-containing protein n=1 Tax=Peptostreptococcus equinus TaxID=3003601 RepID=A0ABY7JRK9_9FIRM|nr:hypothetical protein [Peptostreptococcus sp. CBA3647]WAW14610.1 hypothetical protein O0R46_08405 [Peptostreptococcus sp. CBA3647]WAW15299.1 hypothetical protein O0R46_02270 [Peptostreptococcus sp. CBA3647]
MDWLKGRVTDTVKPNLASNSLYDWLWFNIVKSTSTPYSLNTTINMEGLTTNDYLNISYEFKSSGLVQDSAVTPYASIIGLNPTGNKVMALNTQSQMFVNNSGVVSISIKVTQDMINAGTIKLVAYYLGYSTGNIYYRRVKVEKGQILTPYIQSSNDIESLRKDIATSKADIDGMKLIDTGLRNDISGLQASRYNLINDGNIPVVNSQNYPAVIYTLDDNTLKDNEKITVFIYGSILADQRFYMCNTVGDTLVASIPSGGISEKKLYIAKSTWKVKDTNNKLLVYPYLNKTTANNTNIDWIVLVRGHVDGISEWIPSKSDVINMQLNTDVKNLKEAEILDRQDIVKLNQEITGEDALIDANNIKFAQLLGVDIATIKGGIV